MNYLEQFKQYIEEENFLQALNAYELNNMNFLNDEELTLLQMNAFLNFIQVAKAKRDFKNFLNNDCFNEARQKLIQYREILQKYNIYRQTDFYELRLQHLEELSKNSDYEKIKNLHTKGLKLLLMKHYKESIPYFNKCLQYDEDHAFFVYLRLANACQGIKDLKTSRYFYEKALELTHEPTAYLKISRFDYFKKHYPQAIKNAKEYLNRKRYEKFVYEHLKDYYLILGQADKVKFFNDQVLKLTFLGTTPDKF